MKSRETDEGREGQQRSHPATLRGAVHDAALSMPVNGTTDAPYSGDRKGVHDAALPTPVYGAARREGADSRCPQSSEVVDVQ